MTNFEAEELKVLVDAATPGVIHANFTGKSNSRDPGKALRPWFEQLLGVALSKSASVAMHFEKLEYFNSSTIAAVIQMMNAAQDKKVKLELTYDSKLRWQTLSFDALKRAIRPFEASGTTVTIRAL